MSFKSTMGIPTRSASRPQPVQKATAAKTTTPKGGKSRAKRHSKSPTLVDVNSILADINLPQTRFANVLTVLGNAAKRNDKTEGNPTLPEGVPTQQTRRRTETICPPAKTPP